MGKIERKSAYGKFKSEQAEQQPQWRELSPQEKKEFQDIIHTCKEQIIKDKKAEHPRHRALGYGNLELYMLEMKKVIRLTANNQTFAIIGGRIEDYQMWSHYYKKYQEAVAKKNYATRKTLQDLDKSKL